MKSIKDYFLGVLTICLIAIIFLQRECSPKPIIEKPKTKTVIQHDTTYITITKHVQAYTPKIKKKVIPKVIPDTLRPDTSYNKLAKQFNKLVKQYVDENIYQDSIKVDSLGYITLIDTVQYNKLKSRSASFSLTIPHVIERITVTEYAAPVRQLYVGGSILSNKDFNAYNAQVGALYKTKTDHMFGPVISFNTSGQMMYGFQMYWKIKLKK